jgi:hypothetical protein
MRASATELRNRAKGALLERGNLPGNGTAGAGKAYPDDTARRP